MLCRYGIFYILKVCGNLVLNKSTGTLFLNSICLLCHILGNFHDFSNLVYVLTAQWTSYYFVSFPLLWPPHSLRHNIKFRLINNAQVASKHWSERSCTSLTFNQKLEMIKLNSEGMLKVKTRGSNYRCGRNSKELELGVEPENVIELSQF